MVAEVVQVERNERLGTSTVQYGLHGGQPRLQGMWHHLTHTVLYSIPANSYLWSWDITQTLQSLHPHYELLHLQGVTKNRVGRCIYYM